MKSRNNADQPRDEELQRVEQLLRNSLPSVGSEPEQDRDLWPTMLRRMDEQASRGAAAVPWFDWALGGALLAFAAVAPRTIPVILYYL
jgi:hypothetical protein